MAAQSDFYRFETCPSNQLPADVRGEASYLSRRMCWGATRIERDPALRYRGVGLTPLPPEKENLGNDEGLTKLMIAVRSGAMDEVQKLLESSADPNARDRQGNTSLHKAAIAGSTAKAQLLVDHGANLEAHNRFGRTPLHEAANVGWPDVCKLLLRLGASPYAKDGPLLDGQTYPCAMPTRVSVV